MKQWTFRLFVQKIYTLKKVTKTLKHIELFNYNIIEWENQTEVVTYNPWITQCYILEHIWDSIVHPNLYSFSEPIQRKINFSRLHTIQQNRLQWINIIKSFWVFSLFSLILWAWRLYHTVKVLNLINPISRANLAMR